MAQDLMMEEPAPRSSRVGRRWAQVGGLSGTGGWRGGKKGKRREPLTV